MSSNDTLDKVAASSEPAPDSADEQHTRREAGARRETSEPLVFCCGDRTIDGWALNISHGGLRAVIDEPLGVGEEVELEIGESGVRRTVRVVWMRTEKGGAIVGVAFTDQPPGSVPPPPDSNSEAVP